MRILLHGYFHQAPEAVPQGLSSFLSQRVMSAGEAEFAAISRDEGESRLGDGLAMLESLGLSPDGFVAPAWQMKRWLLPLLAARGLRYTEDHLRVYDPVARRARASLVLNFASRTPARLWSSAAFVRAALPMRGLVPTRIAIHPGDMRHGVLVRETRRALGLARGTFAESVRELLG